MGGEVSLGYVPLVSPALGADDVGFERDVDHKPGLWMCERGRKMGKDRRTKPMVQRSCDCVSEDAIGLRWKYVQSSNMQDLEIQILV